MDQAIEMLQEVARIDLEACEAAIKNDDRAAALDTIERAFAKIDTVIDILRSAAR
jgi:hypothetical protein